MELIFYAFIYTCSVFYILYVMLTHEKPSLEQEPIAMFTFMTLCPIVNTFIALVLLEIRYEEEKEK